MTRLAVLIALLVVPVAVAADQPAPPNDYGPLPTIGGVSAESRIEPRLSAVATNLAGRSVEARCWSSADWSRLDEEWRAYVGTGLEGTFGYVRKSARHRLHIHPRICAQLVALTYRNYRPRPGAGREAVANAILTFAHEAQHSAGISSEQTAECYGLQRVRVVARALGATKTYAAALARLAWTLIYPVRPPETQSAACRNGGRLDLNPLTAIWP